MVAMETPLKSCPLTLWIILLSSLHHYHQVSSNSRPCPSGQLIHTGPYNNNLSCCYPTRCSVGEEVRPCSTNGTHDSCWVCRSLQNQLLRTSSFTMDRCIDWPLDKINCRSVNNPERKVGFDELTKRCICNIELGQKFDPPENQGTNAPIESYCQNINGTCQAGQEPDVNGRCNPCKENYFKSQSGFSLCEPKTNCTLLGLEFTALSNATADNNCSQPDPIVTTTTPIPQATKTVAVSTTDVANTSSTTLTTTTRGENIVNPETSWSPAPGPNDESGDIAGLIVGSVLGFFLVLMMLMIVIVCGRRRGRCQCLCAETMCCPHTERNPSQVIASERGLGNGCDASYRLLNGHKTTRNRGTPSSIEDLPNSCTNGHSFCDHIHETDHGGSTAALITSDLQNATGIHMQDILRATKRDNVIGPRLVIVDVIPKPPLRVDGDNLKHSVGIGGENQELNGKVVLRPKHVGEPAVAYSQAVDEVKFTTSGSLIASPVGEVDEGFRMPRFSQLLEGEETSVTDSSHAADCLPFHQQSSQESPCKLAYSAAQGAPPKSGYPAAVVGPVTLGNSQTDEPDHLILSLKNPDNNLQESLQAPVSNTNSNTQVKVTTGPPLTTGHFEVEDGLQTQPKTLTLSSPDKFLKTSPGSDVKAEEEPGHKNLERERQKHDSFLEESTPGKKIVKLDNDFQHFSNRKRVLNGDRILVGNYLSLDGDQKKLQQFSSKESDTNHLYNHVVPFNKGENQSPDVAQLYPKLDLKQTVRSQASTDKSSSTYRNRGPLRSKTDPPQGISPQEACIENEEAQMNGAHLILNSSSSQKSVISDQREDEDSTGNPGKSSLYRRSQSQNAPSSLEFTPRKLPLRSISEEKPQKVDKPIAKVKPMPASDTSVNQANDTSVNQLPMDTSVNIVTLQHGLSPTSTNPNLATNLNSSSDSSDLETGLDNDHHSMEHVNRS